MKKDDQKSDDKYHVTSSSINDLDGCAATEATGLIPSLPRSGAELDAYRSILPYSPDCITPKKSSKKETMSEGPQT